MDAVVNTFIRDYKLFGKGDNLLLALSGGKDSMALLYFLNRNEYKVSVAHCNFQLRGEESEEDANFIRAYCLDRKIPCYIQNIDTAEYAEKKGISIQEAARETRYEFLEKVRLAINAKYILTAHHLQDNIETLWFKVAKGTGIKGLRGIKPKSGVLVRPFLGLSVDQIFSYVKGRNIPFREDSSNASTKYTRNKIRKEILPVLHEVNPMLEKTMRKHFERWREMELLHLAMLEMAMKKLFDYRNGVIYIPIAKLNNLAYKTSLLYSILEKYGFNTADVEDLIQSMESNKEVKVFKSITHKLLKDRKFLILQNIENEEDNKYHLIQKNTSKISFHAHQKMFIKQKPISKLSKLKKGASHCYVDADKISFPLILRRWEPGDYFYPLGFYKESGKPSKKNMGKFLRDLKTDALEKERTWVISTESKIIWVVGIRPDERFKVTENTKHFIHFELK